MRGPSKADYDKAVRAFWTGRDVQRQKQLDKGLVLDAGSRNSVTGGLHLTALQDLIAAQFDSLAAIGAEIYYRGVVPLPGFYRRAKSWDIVVTYQDVLVAAIELKSQVGSFGNNFNNRTEEALGNAVDLWRAYEDGLLGTIRPWLGFVMVLERGAGSSSPVRDRGNQIFPTDAAFDMTSYTERYQLLFQRLMRERLYDVTCLTSSVQDGGIYDEPMPELSTRNLTASIAARVEYIRQLSLGQ